MNGKHTKGKWIIDGDLIGVEIEIAGETFFVEICQTAVPGLYNTSDKIEEEAANQKLILSAPQLLEALKLIMFAGEEPWRNANNAEGPTYQAMMHALAGIKQTARAAIEAAEGGEK